MSASRRNVAFVVISVALHLLLLTVIGPDFFDQDYTMPVGPVHISVVQLGDETTALPDFRDVELDALPEILPEPPKPEPPKPEPPKPEGQIVEIAPPKDQSIPDKSDFLAEYNSTVPKQTRTESYKVNPEILSNVYSRDQKMGMEQAPEVGATEISTGAPAGGSDEQPGGNGAPYSALPVPYQLTNKAGLASPTLSSSGSHDIEGAPQNDRLDVPLGDRVALNARELAGADYLNRIRRMVNHYWTQNIENAAQSAYFSKDSYRTIVEAVLTSDGHLESVAISLKSSSDVIDNCLVNAFWSAAPFPNPPEQLISRDGRVYLPDFDFELNFTHAQAQYQGIDPRAGVQFPGILKNPR